MRQFVESLRRLYLNSMISEEKVIFLFNNKKITKEEMDYILTYKQSE